MITKTSKLLRITTGLALLASVSCIAQQPIEDTPAVEREIDAMLAKLSLERKIDLIGCKESLYIGPIREIGLPRLTMSDGPMGVKAFGNETVFANGAGLAATWAPALAEQVGQALVEEARATGTNFLLSPGMNIARSPLAGRNFEDFGEDPLLASRSRAVHGIVGNSSENTPLKGSFTLQP